MVRVADLIPPPSMVEVNNIPVAVRGLTLKEISVLLSKHQDVLVAFLGSGVEDKDSLVASAPNMVAEIIATAMDADDQVEDVKRLPFNSQVDLLQKTWELSVPDLKKLVRSLSKLVATAKESDLQNVISAPQGNSLKDGSASP